MYIPTSFPLYLSSQIYNTKIHESERQNNDYTLLYTIPKQDHINNYDGNGELKESWYLISHNHVGVYSLKKVVCCCGSG